MCWCLLWSESFHLLCALCVWMLLSGNLMSGSVFSLWRHNLWVLSSEQESDNGSVFVDIRTWIGGCLSACESISGCRTPYPPTAPIPVPCPHLFARAVFLSPGLFLSWLPCAPGNTSRLPACLSEFSTGFWARGFPPSHGWAQTAVCRAALSLFSWCLRWISERQVIVAGNQLLVLLGNWDGSSGFTE